MPFTEFLYESRSRGRHTECAYYFCRKRLVWILKQFEAVPKPDQTDWLVKFFVVREGETRYGFLRVEGQPAVTSKIDPPQPTAKSLDEWLAVLRDRQQVINAAREVAKLATAADAERAMSALLAAAEFVDAADQSQAPVVQELMQTMRKLDQSGKTPAIVRTLREGPPRARQFAINSVRPLKNFTTDKEFPALAEHVMTVAAGEYLWPRVLALGLLGETLAVTKLDPAEFSTEERREMVRQLAVNVPHDRVHQLVVAALSDKQIDVALAAAEQFAKLPDETTDAKVQAKLVEVLANVIKGKLGDAVASRGQRAQALTALISLSSRGAPAIPALIEVLKSDDPDLKPAAWSPRTNEDAQFTHERIIKALEVIGLLAKDALPALEAALAVIEKKEKEDALLSPKTPGRGQSTNPISERLLSERLLSERLREVINHIKLEGNGEGHRS